VAANYGAKSKASEKGSAVRRQICVTFDELPVAQSFGNTDRRLVTDQILGILDRHGVKAAGFVVGSAIQDDYDLLGAWLNKGHVLGNLTYSLQDLHQIGPENFIREIREGNESLEMMLAGFGQKRRYFRYPYLHYGADVAGKRMVNGYLRDNDMVVAHATVVVEDYLYNLSLEKLGGYADTTAYLELMQEYLNHVVDEVERSEEMATQLLGRSCRQILQLKVNRLNAAFIDDLLYALEDMGYLYIGLDEALKDDLFDLPEAYYDGRGVGYIEMVMKSNPDLMPAE